MGFNFKKSLNSFLGSLLLSFGIYILFNYVFGETKSVVMWPFWISLVGFSYWFYKSDTIRRIWGRTFVGLSIISFLLPIVVCIFGIRQTVKQEDAFSAAGTAIGTGIATVFIGILAFFMGIVFVISAYFTYKDISRPVTIEKKKSK